MFLICTSQIISASGLHKHLRKCKICETKYQQGILTKHERKILNLNKIQSYNGQDHFSVGNNSLNIERFYQRINNREIRAFE